MSKQEQNSEKLFQFLSPHGESDMTEQQEKDFDQVLNSLGDLVKEKSEQQANKRNEPSSRFRQSMDAVTKLLGNNHGQRQNSK